MEKNKIIITSVSVIVLFAFLSIVYVLTNKPEKSINPQLLKIKQTDHIKWAKNKKNILIEYSDLQCPACKKFQQILKQIESSGSADYALTKKITFVYRHFPLTTIHQNAYQAAIAAESASKQGKFFQMADKLFETQETWSETKNPQNYFEKTAQELKLDINKFKADMKNKQLKNNLQENISSGQELGINSTPTFFLNGKKLEIKSLDQFVQALKNAP